MGAAFLILPLLAVAAVILWPGRKSDGMAAPEAEPAAADVRPASRAADPNMPSDLLETLERFLCDRRLSVTRMRKGGDLRVDLPPGRTLFRLHSEVARAAASWGAELISAQEESRPQQGTTLTLTLRRGGETRSVVIAPSKTIAVEPRLALVIDDFGFQSIDMIETFAELPLRFTPAVLPGYPRSAEAARILLESGHPPILHLPMEPKDYPRTDPGTGAVMSGMPPERIGTILDGHHATIPGIVGVSNHMGSRASEDRAAAFGLMQVLAERGLFFLDSGTSDESLFAHEAARHGVRCLTADLFLDGDPRPDSTSMARRLAEARELAGSCGSVIMVGHARKETRAFLPVAADSLRSWGIRLVPLADLLR